MITREITIVNKLGLHARSATKLAKTAEQFAAKVRIGKGESTVDGKSVMSLMLLAASRGTVLEVCCEGPDEEDAIEAIASLVNSRFEEEE